MPKKVDGKSSRVLLAQLTRKLSPMTDKSEELVKTEQTWKPAGVGCDFGMNVRLSEIFGAFTAMEVQLTARTSEDPANMKQVVEFYEPQMSDIMMKLFASAKKQASAAKE